ncbi:hypothetical protein OTK49_02925 [Vibrio coralliirubri]|uniref:hypothetical protein n=1 Tax=Vibrio coralliirubri TaxID=1516159 RepID=UPI0022842D43|nr:hypothetical protein [Vibrio coralliirubri]MCY9861468.1 hypothetical protein [Vibrio coralliirubri]
MGDNANKVVERLLISASSCGEAAHKYFGNNSNGKLSQSYNYFTNNGVVIFVKQISYEIYSVDVLERVDLINDNHGYNAHHLTRRGKAHSIIKRIRAKPKHHVFGSKVCTR